MAKKLPKLQRPSLDVVLRRVREVMNDAKLDETKTSSKLLDALAERKEDGVHAVISETMWRTADWTLSAKIGPVLQMLRRELR